LAGGSVVERPAPEDEPARAGAEPRQSDQRRPLRPADPPDPAGGLRQQRQRAWRAGQYATACQSALRALKLDPAASGASQVSDRCESKAREFFEEGENLQRTDVNQAKSYWRKVLNMVPRNNPYYAKAYSALNNAGRRRLQDEDE